MKKLLALLITSLTALAQTPTQTPNLGLYKPAHGTLNWDSWYNQNWDKLDTLAGSVPLNVTHYPGSDLGQQITAALAACPSTGCAIEIPAGATGFVFSPIVVTKPNVKIFCDGSRSAHITQAFHGGQPASGSLFYVVNADRFELTGCYLDSNKQNDPYTATNQDNGLVFLLNSNFAHIHDNYFRDGGTPAYNSQNGVRISGGTSVNNASPACSPASITCQQGFVTGSYNEIDHNTFDAIPWMNCTDGENGGYNDYHDNILYSPGEAFDFNGNNVDSPGSKFHHNVVINQGLGSFLESVTSASIDGNTFTQSGAQPTIYIHTAVTTVQAKSKIVNNIFIGNSGSTNAIWLFANTLDIDISNNQMFGYGQDGILIGTNSGNVQRTTIRDNEIQGIGTSGNGYCAIHLATAASGVVDTWITGNLLASASASGGYGICSDNAAPVNAVIIGNTSSINFPAGCSSCSISSNQEGSGDVTTRTAATFVSSLKAAHIGGNGSAPTGACGAVAGTCTGVSVTGNDHAGSFSFTSGTTAPSSGGTIFGLTFASTYTSTPVCVVSPANSFAGNNLTWYVSAGTTGMNLLSTNGSYPASVALVYRYVCVGN